jgi:hypothetical protein
MMLRKISAVLGLTVGCVAFLFFLGSGIGTLVPMPPYAYVYVDDDARTYIALPCIEEWRTRTTGDATLRLAQFKEIRPLKYKGDQRCRDTGAFMPEGRSASGRLLQWFGVLPPLTYWWDQPFRKEDGSVVYPKLEE